MVNTLNKSEDGGVEVRGIMLSKEVGLYAARIMDTHKDKEVTFVGPSNIQYDKGTNEFLISFPPIEADLFYSEEPKQMEVYIREARPERIKYNVA